MKTFITITLAAMLAALVAGCGGDPCDAGTPPFANQKSDCPKAVEPPASAASR